MPTTKDVIYRVGSGDPIVLIDQTSPLHIANTEEALIEAWVSRAGKTAQAGAVAPAFSGRSARFDGTATLTNQALTGVTPGKQGTMAFWYYHDVDVWNESTARLIEARVGTAPRLDIRTASLGRLRFQVGPSANSWTPNGFNTERTWHHLIWTWNEDTLTQRLLVDGTTLLSNTFTDPIEIDAGLDQIGVGAVSTGANSWTGDLGHFYFNPNVAIDLTDSAEIAKFISGGSPVDLGPTGALPTGTAPTFYFDGVGSAWNNVGTGPTLTATGTITAGTTPAIP